LEIDDDRKTMKVKKDWRAANLSEREAVLCRYAEKLTLHPDQMEPSDLKPLRQVGLSDAGILDACEVAAYFNYINRIADGLGVDLESFMERP
jgi:uncharacterized peroxidase-related enzyme